jgi:hypothetical protein
MFITYVVSPEVVCIHTFSIFSCFFFSSIGAFDLTKINTVLHVYFQKGPKGHFWTKRPDFQVPSEEELKRLLASESVSSSSYTYTCVNQFFLDDKPISRKCES